MARDILTVCNGGAQITRIMFHAYMTHAQVKSYTNELIESGLVKYDRLERKYYTTPTGIEHLSRFDRISDLLSLTIKRSASCRNSASGF